MAAAVLLGLAACSPVPLAPPLVSPWSEAAAQAALTPSAPIRALRHLGTRVLVRTDAGPMQHFGGISGMAWDAARGTLLLLSDDRSERAPARLYSAALAIGPNGFDVLDVNGVIPLRQVDGSTFPDPRQGGEVPDPEALRIDPADGSLVWSSEGDRRLGVNPAVRRAARDGSHLGLLPLPAHFAVDKNVERGARGNLNLEGLAFTPDATALWLAMESPRYEDGPVPTSQHGGFVRFARLARRGEGFALGAEYVYPVDAIPVAATGGRGRADNGVSEILGLAGDALLVVERAGHEVDAHRFEFNVRLYEARLRGATDVAALDALPASGWVPMGKRLLLDLNRAGLGHIDNIEAATWGPRLPGGARTLLLASDDNFAPNQVTQLMLFEVLE